MRIGRCVDTEACSVIVVVVLMLTDFVLDFVVWSSQIGLEVESWKIFWVEAMFGVMKGKCDRLALAQPLFCRIRGALKIPSPEKFIKL